MTARLRAPYPYYGSKIGAAGLIERLMGPINNLVIPFAGSLGELLGRSEPAKVETVNELCDHPVHETTLHAAHDLLLASAEQLPELLRSNPRAHDVELAAWWRHEWRPDGEVIWASPHCVRDDFGPLFASEREADV